MSADEDQRREVDSHVVGPVRVSSKWIFLCPECDSDRLDTILEQRGRWKSDIHKIYTRALLSQHLRVSVAVGTTVSPDLEAVCHGWTQPAHFR